MENLKSVLCFLILESVLLNLTPNEGFRRILKLCCGIIVILMILQPAAKIFGISDTFGNFLKEEEQKQLLRQCESELNQKTEWLAGTYRSNYEQAVQENIAQLVETEGMSLDSCVITWNEQETEISDIYMQLGDGGLVSEIKTVEVSISAKEKTQEVENPQVIKIRNEITDRYQIAQEHIFIETSS